MKNKIYSNIFEYNYVQGPGTQAVSFLIFRKSQARFLIAGFLFKNYVHYYTWIDRDPGFNPGIPSLFIPIPIPPGLNSRSRIFI